jgi:hypothetical protein
MFERDWTLCGPGPKGGDRKTHDVHMHLMEAFTNMYECTKQEIHRRTLLEDIDILLKKILHKRYGTGIPQFWVDWKDAPQLKLDIIWGWDGSRGRQKAHAEDNTSEGSTSNRLALDNATAFWHGWDGTTEGHQEGDGSRQVDRHRPRVRRSNRGSPRGGV